MRAVAFDLGDTLVEYEGMPFSWEAHYPAALGHLATSLGISLRPEHVDRACAILRRYNTRLTPRETEVSFAAILDELLRAFDFPGPAAELPCATAFFRIFRQRLRCFSDTVATLTALKQRGLKIGVFTDVPYGMPRELVLEDVSTASVTKYFDVLLTSRDVGFRKPAPVTLETLARALSCELREMVYVGNEQKDVMVARSCGCPAILIDRAKHGKDWSQDRTIASLAEL